jgi:hypothetical protein
MELTARLPHRQQTARLPLPPLGLAAAGLAACGALAAGLVAADLRGGTRGATPTRLESPGIQAPTRPRPAATKAGRARAHAGAPARREVAGSASAPSTRLPAQLGRAPRINPVTGLPYGEAPRLAENVEGDYDPLTDSYVNQGSYR